MANLFSFSTPLNSYSACGKLVQNPVKKPVETMFEKVVEKRKMFKNQKLHSAKTHKLSTFKQIFTNKINKIYTSGLSNSYLKIPSFPLFPHRTITTITTFK